MMTAGSVVELTGRNILFMEITMASILPIIDRFAFFLLVNAQIYTAVNIDIIGHSKYIYILK